MEGQGADLVQAAAAGALAKLEELLARPDADVNAQDENGDTTLYAACAHGHVAVVRWLLDAGARLDVKNKQGDSVLHAAASGGEAALVDMLMITGFDDVDVRNEDDWTPAHVAVKAKSDGVLQSLVKNGADLKLVTKLLDEDETIDGCSFLHVAASVDNVDAIKYLVKAGVEVDFCNQVGRTPLHQAAACGSLGAVQELLASGAELDAKDEADRTPVYRAAVTGHRSVAAYLLDEGADVNTTRPNGWTPLRGAVLSGDMGTIKLLVDRGAKLDSLDEDGQSMLHVAAEYGKLDAVQFFLDNGLQADTGDAWQQTPLFLAAWRGHRSVVELLLDAGADVSAATSYGRLPLHHAAWSGDLETMKLLVERGADVHSLTTDGESVLFYASLSGSKEAVEFLLANGLRATINSAGEDGYTAIHMAAQAGATKTIELLLELGADVHAVTKAGWTVLHTAASAGSVEAVELLLQKGVDIHALTEEGKSALQGAANIGNDVIAQALVRGGADTKKVNKINGWTTFHYAAHGGIVDLLKIFLDIGADMEAVAKDGKTALHVACSTAYEGMEAVKYLLDLGMDPNNTDADGKAALHHAAESENSCLFLLLDSEAKASIDKPDKDGNRALHFTAKKHWVQGTEALLKAGADAHVFTNDGESPLQLAVFAEPPSKSALSTVWALCRFGSEWTSSCQERLVRTKEEVEADTVDETDGRYEHLEWCMGLRACILHWEQQHRDGIKASTKVPMEVVQRGEVSVRTYVGDATSSDADKVTYRCKVCVVGPSEWGKSSLVRSIETMKPFLVDSKDRTIGIDLVATSLRGFDAEKLVDNGAKISSTPETTTQAVEITTNQESPRHHEVTFWDFAGQDVYQVAHSLFFSRRTVYILVVDVKAYSDQLDVVESLRSAAAEAAMDRFLSRYVFRWVRTIFAHQPDAEFLVLGTKADLLNDEAEGCARVWRDLQSRIYQWKLNYMREIEAEFGVVTKSSSMFTGKSVTVDQTGRGATNARVQELTEKLARLASDQWIVVSVTRTSSIEAVRLALRHAIEASDRGFPMWEKYSRVLQVITDMRAAVTRSGDGQRRIDHGMMMSRPLCAKVMAEMPDLTYEECCVILRTLHDLGDVIWYDHEDAGPLRDFIILDPMLVIDVVREVVSHEHVKNNGAAIENQAGSEEEQPRLDGRVAHSLLKTLPLWKNMDRDMMYAFKMLLHQFQLAYSADDGQMDPESDLIVPSYWKLQLEAAIVKTTLPPSAADTTASRIHDGASLAYHHCWEYEVPADLSDSIFDRFAVQSDATSIKRTVRAGCIETSCAEFQSWVTLTPGTSKHDVIRVEVASETMDMSWHYMRFYLMKLEKVLDAYPGLSVPRYIIVDGKRHSLAPAAKAVNNSIMMGREVDDLRLQMPWLPPDLDWFIHRAWRDLKTFQELQMMHLVRDKLNVLQKLVVQGDAQRRYPALWSLEYVAEKRVAILRIFSDLSGRCYHQPIEIEVPPELLAKHGSKIKEGISLLANVVPGSLSVPILQTAIDCAVKHLETKTQQATEIHNLIERLDLSTTTGNSIKTSTESRLSPGGAMAILRDLLKLHNDSLDEWSITEICNLECAATAKGKYVWAHPHEIRMLKKELTPCQPQFEADSELATSTSSEPHEEPDSFSSSGSKLCLSLCIETVTGLTNWDWYKTYCRWQLLYGDRKTPLATGATTTNADSSVQPSWLSLKSTIDGIASVEMLQECRLVVQVKRRSHIGWTKTIGEGQVDLRSLVAVDDKVGLKCDPIRVTLPASGSGSTERVVLCRVIASRSFVWR